MKVNWISFQLSYCETNDYALDALRRLYKPKKRTQYLELGYYSHTFVCGKNANVVLKD